MLIEAQTRALLDRFSRAAAGLFEITGRYTETFEQGLYGCAIAKPTKRMKAALGADRELLIVVSTFPDQQQRTVKLVKREVEKSGGRYEPTLAIVIHCDPEGNSKLKNWGRDLGISILPLCGPSDLIPDVNLEHILCVELYSHDPFDVTGPVSDDANFYGRRDEASDLARKLQRGQIRSCLGIRKIGKTSIINRILKEIQNNYECTCLMIDCSRDDVWSLGAAQLLDSLRATIEHARTSGAAYSSIVPVSTTRDLRTARDALEACVLVCDKPLILIFDEVDYITPGSPTTSVWRTEFNVYWRNLRSVYQEAARRGRTMSLLVGGVSTYWFTQESIDGIENAALSFIPEEYLSPMPEGATIAMLKRLGRVSGLQFDDSAAELIARATGNMPYWARKCASYIQRQVPVPERPCVITAARIDPLVEAFVGEEGSAIAEVALRNLFRVHPGLREATAKCHANEAASVSEQLRRILRRYGVLSPSDGLSGAMIARAFAALSHESTSEVAPAVSVVDDSSKLGFGEWAEELAALGKRRNLLERRLREIVLNFLRFDSLTGGKQVDLRNRVTAIVSSKKNESLRHLTAEESMNRLLWTDLAQLISREWPLFERLFGDRERFQRACEVINERFDAHAKAADAADFALYRRALSQVEECVARIQ